MDYITITELSNKCGVSPRRIQKLCEDKRYQGRRARGAYVVNPARR